MVVCARFTAGGELLNDGLCGRRRYVLYYVEMMCINETTVDNREEKSSAYAMKRVAAGAHLPTARIF